MRPFPSVILAACLAAAPALADMPDGVIKFDNLQKIGGAAAKVVRPAQSAPVYRTPEDVARVRGGTRPGSGGRGHGA